MSTPAATLRIYNALQDGAEHTTLELSERCFTTRRHVQFMLKIFHSCGLAHISGWIRPPMGDGAKNRMFIAKWVRGPGRHAPKPDLIPSSEIRRARLLRLKQQHGTTVANKILSSRTQGGASVLMVEGEIVFKRGKPRGRYVRNNKQGASA